MKRGLFIICVILLGNVMLFAEGTNKEKPKLPANKEHVATIKGGVYEMVNGEKIALPFGNVFVDGTTDITNSDMEGNYKLVSGLNNFKIKCTYKGYKAFEKEVSFNGNGDINLDIVLEKE